MQKKVDAVFKDISEEKKVSRFEIPDDETEAGYEPEADEDGDVKNPDTMQRADRSAFVTGAGENTYLDPEERARRMAAAARKRKERRQVIFLLTLIFVLLIITGILFYTPEL